MKANGLAFYLVASIAVHAAAIGALSWFNVDDSRTPPKGFVHLEISYAPEPMPSTDRVLNETAPLAGVVDGEGVSPADPPTPPVEASVVEDADEPEAPRDSQLTKPAPPMTAEQTSAESEPREVTLAAAPPQSEVSSSSVDPPPTQSAAVAPSERALTRFVEPVYPRSARRLGHEGRVVIQVTIAGDGNVHEARVAVSSGHDELDQAARKAAEKSRFAPHSAGAISDEDRMLAFRFQLENDE